VDVLVPVQQQQQRLSHARQDGKKLDQKDNNSNNNKQELCIGILEYSRLLVVFCVLFLQVAPAATAEAVLLLAKNLDGEK
jgi:hypothetical protein